MLKGWNSLFQSKKYIGSNFLTLYQRKNTPFIPTHVKSGLLTYSSLPGDAQLVVYWHQWLSSILFRGVFNL
jgi:hypothetical protein